MAYDNSNSFALFKNDKKGNEKAPNSKGPGEITCQHCGEVNHLEFAGWTRATKNGDPMISGKVQPKREKAEKKPAETRMDDEDQGIPF